MVARRGGVKLIISTWTGNVPMAARENLYARKKYIYILVLSYGVEGLMTPLPFRFYLSKQKNFTFPILCSALVQVRTRFSVKKCPKHASPVGVT